MRRAVGRSVALAGTVASLALLLATTACALSVTHTYDRGTTTRVIWDTSQVACFKLPGGVNHVGPIHMELVFRPAWADLDLYLLDADGNAVGGVAGEQGYLASFTGRETVDYYVGQVLSSQVEPYYGGVPGDTYYVLVVAFNETARFQILGYYPRIVDPVENPSTTDAFNYYLRRYRKPARARRWITIHGPEYGYPYSFRPTSVGKVEARLEWPADVVKRRVLYTAGEYRDHIAPADMEQHMYYGPAWDIVWENLGGTDWRPPQQDDGAWFGLKNPAPGEPQGTSRDGYQPFVAWHYVPSLYLVASDPLLGPDGGPKLGVSTVGFRATLTYPENLRIASAPRAVELGRVATVRGTYALDGEWAVGAEVTLERKTAGGWRRIKSVAVGADGGWAVGFRPTVTGVYRAVAPGTGAPNLDVEVSRPVRIRVVP